MDAKSFTRERREAAHAFDRARLSAAIIASRGSVLAAARSLEMPTSYFYRRARTVGLNINEVRASITPATNTIDSGDTAPV